MYVALSIIVTVTDSVFIYPSYFHLAVDILYELNEEYCQLHYLAGLLLTEVCVCTYWLLTQC